MLLSRRGPSGKIEGKAPFLSSGYKTHEDLSISYLIRHGKTRIFIGGHKIDRPEEVGPVDLVTAVAFEPF